MLFVFYFCAKSSLSAYFTLCAKMSSCIFDSFPKIIVAENVTLT